MFEANEPIIRSRLDTDYYKLTMGQFVWHRYRHMPVSYGLTNRTKGVQLAKTVDQGELREQLDHLRGLSLTPAESAYVLSQGFDPDFVQWLSRLRLPEYELSVRDDGQFDLQFHGPWSEAIWWETPALAILNELHNRALERRDGLDHKVSWTEGRLRLMDKMRLLVHAGVLGKIVEFGTRRRYSREWQEKVVGLLLEKAPRLIAGTSNVALALKFGIPAKGTMAHELFMAYSGIHDDGTDAGLLRSHDLVLRDWWDEYGQPLSIALPDTYGSEAFFRGFTPEWAAAWKGLRQDSGDAIVFGERAIAFYSAFSIDPKIKLVMFSDGLDVQRIISLERHFAGRIGTAYGWGTNLTNDCGYPALSLVVKLIESAGRPTVKLSDNLAKAIGPADQVARFKRAFGYTVTSREECVY